MSIPALVFFACALMAGQSSWAQLNGTCGASAYYDYDPGTNTLTISGSGSMSVNTWNWPWESVSDEITSVIIEDGITSIGDDAFWDFDGLEEITIPASVQKIGMMVFESCDRLEHINFAAGSQLTTIEDRAFESCHALTTINIPSSVTNIGGGILCDCENLTSITVAAGNAYYKTDASGALYTIDGTKLLAYPLGRNAAVYTIPRTVTTIGRLVFYECQTIEEVVFENGSALEKIDDFAFAYCNNLASINIPESVSFIGSHVFDDTPWNNTLANNMPQGGFVTFGTVLYKVDSGISGSFEVGNNITTIAGNAFYGCSGLESVIIPDNVTYIGDAAFEDCSSLESVSFTGTPTIEVISDEIFYSCGSLTNITIPASVTFIGYGAFSRCTALTSIVIPNNVTYIGMCAFEMCDHLEEVIFESVSKVDTIDGGAFYKSGITTISIPVGVKYIASDAFQGCNALTAINVNENNTCYTSLDGLLLTKDERTLVSYPAAKNPNNVIIPASVTEIADYAFMQNENITAIIIPESVTAIGELAFDGCTALETVIIPESVTSLGRMAFSECDHLNNVYVLPAIPSFYDDIFCDINDDCHFYLHGNGYDNDTDWSSNVIDRYANCTIIYSLALDAGITATGSAAFTANGRSYYTEDAAITISGGNSEAPVGYQPGSFAGYTKNNVSIAGNTFEMPAQDVRIRAIWTPIEWEGTGAENDPYMIVYPSQMDLLAERVNTGTDYTDTYFKLANDITFSYDGYGPTESNYLGVGMMSIDNNQEINEIHQQVMPTYRGFNGIFDGNGKTISGVRMYSPTDTVTPSIFNVVTNPGVVKNLTVRDTKITAVSAAGGIVGTVNGGSIEKCISYADLFILKSNSPMTPTGIIGGIAGENIFSGRVYNCTSYSTIKIEDNTQLCIYVGGVVGAHTNNSVTDNCYSYASIVVGDNANLVMGLGGITGTIQEDCSITNCFSSATILFGGNLLSCREFGGIVGYANDGVISRNIVVDAVIPDLDCAGVIMGGSSNEVNLSYNYYSNCSVGLNNDNIGGNGGDITTNDGAVKATILLENEAAPASLADGEKVVFRREFKQGVSSTVCLPVAIDESLASAAGKFFTFAGVDMTDPDDWTVVMQEVAGNNMVDGDLEANTPYLFIPNADGPVLFIGEADGSSVTAGNATNGNWTFQGTYESIEWNAGNADLGKVYGFAAQKYEAPDNNGDSNPDYTVNPGKFVMAGAGASIAPYRSYLMYNPVLSAPSRGGSRPQLSLPGSMKVVLLSSDGVETAVGKINTATGEISIDSWYDMSGRKLQGAPAKGGMYIHGGKTIMINE